MIHQDTDPELDEIPDLECYHQKEGVRNVNLGEELISAKALKDLIWRYPDVLAAYRYAWKNPMGFSPD